MEISEKIDKGTNFDIKSMTSRNLIKNRLLVEIRLSIDAGVKIRHKIDDLLKFDSILIIGGKFNKKSITNH